MNFGVREIARRWCSHCHVVADTPQDVVTDEDTSVTCECEIRSWVVLGNGRRTEHEFAVDDAAARRNDCAAKHRHDTATHHNRTSAASAPDGLARSTTDLALPGTRSLRR